MTLAAQVENFTRGLGELQQLWPIHWEKLALDKDKVALDPDMSEYLRRDAAGILLYIALRDDKALVGYWISFITPGLHYKTCLSSTMDIWNVLPAYEKGMAPVVLMKRVEIELARRKVQRSFVGEKLHRPCGRLYEMFGYKPIERFWSRLIIG